MKTIMTNTPWRIRCAPEFVAEIDRLAILNDFTPDAMYALWMVYVNQCNAADQSPTLPEFERERPWFTAHKTHGEDKPRWRLSKDQA